MLDGASGCKSLLAVLAFTSLEGRYFVPGVLLPGLAIAAAFDCAKTGKVWYF
jgi:hypothetical protein